jgi:hypothetical protein
MVLTCLPFLLDWKLPAFCSFHFSQQKETGSPCLFLHLINRENWFRQS